MFSLTIDSRRVDDNLLFAHRDYGFLLTRILIYAIFVVIVVVVVVCFCNVVCFYTRDLGFVVVVVLVAVMISMQLLGSVI